MIIRQLIPKSCDLLHTRHPVLGGGLRGVQWEYNTKSEALPDLLEGSEQESGRQIFIKALHK